jgi:hypothetical protein
VFTRDEGERRYETIAELVAAQTEPSAMILASIHAGSLRYSAGRVTVRFDILDPDWLDRGAAWLNGHGRHPYVLIEDWEMPVQEAIQSSQHARRTAPRTNARLQGVRNSRKGIFVRFAPSRWADVRAAIDSRSEASMSAACRATSALAAGA